MTARNFSPGDVVVCTRADPGNIFGTPSGLQQGRLYTVESALFASEAWGPENAGKPAVTLVEQPAPPRFGGVYGSHRFRLAYRPDPEVEREAVSEPVKRQRVKETTEPRRGGERAGRPLCEPRTRIIP